MAKFDTQQIIKGFQKNSEYGVIGFLVVVSIFMLIILNHHSDYKIPDSKTIDIHNIPLPKEAEGEIKRAVQELVPMDQSPFQKELLQRNLFSFRDVLSKQALEKEVNDKLKRAQTLFDQGSYQQVVDLCNEILNSNSNLEQAKTLKDKAQKALQGGLPTTTIATTTAK